MPTVRVSKGIYEMLEEEQGRLKEKVAEEHGEDIATRPDKKKLVEIAVEEKYG